MHYFHYVIEENTLSDRIVKAKVGAHFDNCGRLLDTVIEIFAGNDHGLYVIP